MMMFQTITCEMKKDWSKVVHGKLGYSNTQHIHYFVPPLGRYVQYVRGVVCFAARGNSERLPIWWSFYSIWLVIGSFVLLVECICLLLVAVCYIKRHTITDGAEQQKSMAKSKFVSQVANVLFTRCANIPSSPLRPILSPFSCSIAPPDQFLPEQNLLGRMYVT